MKIQRISAIVAAAFVLGTSHTHAQVHPDALTCTPQQFADTTLPVANTNCLAVAAGATASYPADFNVLNKVAEYECPLSNQRIIISNGIVDHDFVQNNPHAPCETPWFVSVPLNPTMASAPLEPAPQGPVFMPLNGVPAYAAQEIGGSNAVEPAAGSMVQDAQNWYGHAEGHGRHHYHSPDVDQSGEHPKADKVVGYALDGFPVFGAVDDASVLDQCNGRYVNGAYQYHLRTKEQVDGAGDYCDGTSPGVKWNYMIGCYSGETSSSIVGDCREHNVPSDCQLVASNNFDGLAELCGLTAPPAPTPRTTPAPTPEPTPEPALEYGKGDCNKTDSNCLGDLVCEKNNGADFGFDKKTDVCVCAEGFTWSGALCEEAEAEEEPALQDCEALGGCSYGEGDCKKADSNCSGNLVCVKNNGADFGFDKKADVCVCEDGYMWNENKQRCKADDKRLRRRLRGARA